MNAFTLWINPIPIRYFRDFAAPACIHGLTYLMEEIFFASMHPEVRGSSACIYGNAFNHNYQLTRRNS